MGWELPEMEAVKSDTQDQDVYIMLYHEFKHGGEVRLDIVYYTDTSLIKTPCYLSKDDCYRLASKLMVMGEALEDA